MVNLRSCELIESTISRVTAAACAAATNAEPKRNNNSFARPRPFFLTPLRSRDLFVHENYAAGSERERGIGVGFKGRLKDR